MKSIHAVVHGKVQGVWFRAWTRDTAKEMGVTGWVRNKSTGEVETVASGNDEVIDTFLQRLYDGPPLARVTRIDVSRYNNEEEFDTFDVRV